MTMQLVQAVTIGSGGGTVTFSNIPQDATDLFILLSLRSPHTTWDTVGIYFNGVQTNLSIYQLEATGASLGGGNSTSRAFATIPGTNVTSGTFANIKLYIPNYASSINKVAFANTISENNAQTGYNVLSSIGWNNTSAITSLTFDTSTSGQPFVEGSTAYLYKITKL